MKIIYFLLIVSMALSCNTNNFKDFDDDDYDCDYSTCNTVEPFYADIKVKFSRDIDNPAPVIYLLSGYYEENKILDTIATDTISDNYIYINVAVGHQYTVYTVYKSGNDTIVAIDGNFVTKESYEMCDSLCWEVENTVFNIKLKK